MYKLDNSHLLQDPSIVIVGTGGTGGFLADQVCRLFTGRRCKITLVDPDTVERRNLLRQAFYPEDIGRRKAEALATRLAQRYDRPVSYCCLPLNDDNAIGLVADNKLVISCVDNAEARVSMAKVMDHRQASWWIDAGNGRNHGQVLIGNVSHAWALRNSFDSASQTCYRLPNPLFQRPDLRQESQDSGLDLDCAAALDLQEQDPAINPMMANLVAHVIRRLLAGDCPYMALYLDLETGTMSPHLATPGNAARMLESHGHSLTEEQMTHRDF